MGMAYHAIPNNKTWEELQILAQNKPDRSLSYLARNYDHLKKEQDHLLTPESV